MHVRVPGTLMGWNYDRVAWIEPGLEKKKQTKNLCLGNRCIHHCFSKSVGYILFIRQHLALKEAWKREYHSFSHGPAEGLRPGAGGNSCPSLGF